MTSHDASLQNYPNPHPPRLRDPYTLQGPLRLSGRVPFPHDGLVFIKIRFKVVDSSTGKTEVCVSLSLNILLYYFVS